MSLFSIFNKKKSYSYEPVTQRGFRVFSGGQPVTEDTSMKSSAFYSGITYISTQIAKLPWPVKDIDNKIVKNSRIGEILNIRPNPEMSAFSFKNLCIQDAIIKGNFYAEIERNMKGQAVALWPLMSENVQPRRMNDEDKTLFYEVLGGASTGNSVYLSTNDIFHVKNFYTKDGITGEGIIWYASEVLGINLGADRFANALYTNGGTPSGVLEVPGNLSKDAALRLKETWQENHGGRKVGGTAVLEEGIKYTPITYTPDVLQFIESRKFSVTEIARFLRIPPTKLFDADTAKYNNIEHANLEVATDTLDAWARNLEQEADIKLLNNGFGGRYTQMDLYDVFRGDMETRAKYFSQMLQTAAITPNEIREKEGFATYEGGDRYYIATNNFSPIDRIDEILDSQMKQNEPVPESTTKDESDAVIVDYLKTKIRMN